MSKIPDTLPISLQALLHRHKDKIQWVDDERDTKDGYWIYLQDGWLFDRETTIIHEYTVDAVAAAFKRVSRDDLH